MTRLFVIVLESDERQPLMVWLPVAIKAGLIRLTLVLSEPRGAIIGETFYLGTIRAPSYRRFFHVYPYDPILMAFRVVCTSQHGPFL